METPDSSPPPHSAEQEAALAAMRRDWAAIREEIVHWDEEMLDCDKRAALLRRTELLKAHIAKHRAALLANGTDPAALETARMEKSLAKFLVADAAFRAAEEAMLQAAAAKAEADQALAISHLELLEAMESAPQEQLDAAPEEARAEFLSAMRNLQENREALLGELPIELRREWNGGCGRSEGEQNAKTRSDWTPPRTRRWSYRSDSRGVATARAICEQQVISCHLLPSRGQPR